MMRAIAVAAVLLTPFLSAGTETALARAVPRPANSPYDIMLQEPGTPGVAPQYHSPRGTLQRPVPVPRIRSRAPRRTETPPPAIIPQTGRVVPSVPITPRGFVPGGGAETFSDRAVRCIHQGGLAGVPNSQQSAYMGSCLSR